MKNKIKEYLDTVFADAERRASDPARLRELKEEMLGDLYDKYDHMIAGGKTPSAAYNAVIAGVGDITELLDSVAGPAPRAEREAPPAAPPLTPEERDALRKKQERGALLTSVAIAMYILCWLPLVILSELLGDLGHMIGLPVMFLMIAGATAMIVYGGMTKVKVAEVKKERGSTRDDGDEDDNDDDDDDEPRSPVYKAISGALWALTLVAYFVISKLTGAWHATWLIFLMAVALDNVIKAIFDLRR